MGNRRKWDQTNCLDVLSKKVDKHKFPLRAEMLMKKYNAYNLYPI